MSTATSKTALVTGASVGIGKAFAEELARRGHDLVLVARDEERLGEVAAGITARHAVRADVLVADLTSTEGVEAVSSRLSAPEGVEVLVNNAGKGSHGPFAEASADSQLSQIDLNVRALVELTHAVLPEMVKRGHGSILNVASVAGFQPLPNEAVYGATKAFVLSFSEGLYEELRGSGVKITALCPGFTRSEFQDRAGIEARHIPAALWQEAGEVAVAGLDALEAGRAVCVPGAHNKVLTGLTRMAPRSVVRASSGFVVRRFG